MSATRDTNVSVKWIRFPASLVGSVVSFDKKHDNCAARIQPKRNKHTDISTCTFD
jgi:hypothetical protein